MVMLLMMMVKDASERKRLAVFLLLPLLGAGRACAFLVVVVDVVADKRGHRREGPVLFVLVASIGGGVRVEGKRVERGKAADGVVVGPRGTVVVMIVVVVLLR
jgi:hypothetical protein